ncbi:MAG: hypothetical protein ACR2PV_00440 [Gammaproteobacteria bacterium]
MPSNFAAEIAAVKTASLSYLPSMRKAKWATAAAQNWRISIFFIAYYL